MIARFCFLLQTDQNQKKLNLHGYKTERKAVNPHLEYAASRTLLFCNFKYDWNTSLILILLKHLFK